MPQPTRPKCWLAPQALCTLLVPTSPTPSSVLPTVLLPGVLGAPGTRSCVPQSGRWACSLPPVPLLAHGVSQQFLGGCFSIFVPRRFFLFAIYSLNRVLGIYLFIFIFFKIRNHSQATIICLGASAWACLAHSQPLVPRELPAFHLRWVPEGPEDDPPPVPLTHIHKWPYSKMTAKTGRIMSCFCSQ